MGMQTLKQAIAKANRGEIRGIGSLDGCPVGGWPETEQAKRQILDSLPSKSDRKYALQELIDALYTVSNDRYQLRA
jgi:hypothetical protein